jgi:GT2 family glycosyltransferase
VIGCSYRGLPTERAAVRNFYGGCACIRREVFDRVGGFNGELGRTFTGHAGGEEAELCLRAHAVLGGHFLYEPSAVIRHRVPDSRVTRRYFVDRCRAEGASKALVQALAGWVPLETESVYLRRTIPTAIVGALRGITQANWTAAAKLGPLLTGVAVTGASYLSARRRLRRRYGNGRNASPDTVAEARPC